MYRRMSLEQMDHFLRHVKQHAEELKQGVFNKDRSYLERLKVARYMALEVSHDMIHVMRIKEFKGYEDADFCFDITLPDEDLTQHEYRVFDATSFKVGCKVQSILNLEIIDERKIQLSKEEAEAQMTALGNAIQDASVLIELLEKTFFA